MHLTCYSGCTSCYKRWQRLIYMLLYFHLKGLTIYRWTLKYYWFLCVYSIQCVRMLFPHILPFYIFQYLPYTDLRRASWTVPMIRIWAFIWTTSWPQHSLTFINTVPPSAVLTSMQSLNNYTLGEDDFLLLPMKGLNPYRGKKANLV